MIVALLGAGGVMGAAMARNLLPAGHEVRAWNRTRERAEPLAGDGATVTGEAAEAVEGADVLVTMLSDADAVLDAARHALAAAGDDLLWLQTSTIGLDGTERAAELAGERGVAFVDAPVLGTKAPAEQGELVVLASGPDEVRERADAVFDAIAKRTLWLGPAGTGTRLKLVTNAWIVTLVEGTAEAIALAEGLGLEPSLLLDAVADGPLDLPYLQIKAKAILERELEPSFRLALAAKDARLVAEAAERHGLRLPGVAAARDQMERAAAEHGDEDIAATYFASAPTDGPGPQFEPIPDA